MVRLLEKRGNRGKAGLRFDAGEKGIAASMA